MALRALQGPVSGTPVGGTGTTNTIPRWTGPSTLGDSIIRQDDGTNRLLIDGGTAAAAANGTNVTIQAQNGGTGNTNGGNVILQPGALSGTGTAGFVRINGTGDVNLYLGNGTGPSAPYGIGQRVFSGQSHTAIFANAGYAAARASLGMVSAGVYTPALSADPSGNVGIGTASPGALLHLSSAATTLRVTSTTATNAGIVRIEAAGGNVYVGRDSSAGGFSGVASSSCFIDSLANPIVLGTSSSERMRISGSAAQVAIGTSSFTSGCSLTVAQSIDVSQSAQGLKLPATPGNADTQTLDCYQEGTWAPTLSAAATWGGTAPTITSARYTRVGRTITCSVILAATGGAAYSSTWGSTTISAPFASGEYSVVPCAREAPGGSNGIQQTSTVYLPTTASSTAAYWITWTYQV